MLGVSFDGSAGLVVYGVYSVSIGNDSVSDMLGEVFVSAKSYTGGGNVSNVESSGGNVCYSEECG